MRPLLVTAAGFLAVTALLAGVLRFDLLRGDALGYWNDSLDWQHPFNPFHVPLYPMALALLRGVTLGAASPLILMAAVNLGSLLAGVVFVRELLLATGEEGGAAELGALLYAFWPFVGIVFAASLQAEVPAMALFLGGLLALQRERRPLGGLLLGLAAVTHKALWPFAGLVVLAETLTRGTGGVRRGASLLAFVLAPLSLLWAAGLAAGHPLDWLVATNLRNEVASRGRIPFLDGLVGTLLRGDPKSLAKGLFVAGLAAGAATLLVLALRRRYPSWRNGAAVAASVLFLAFALNQWEIWATVRFSRLLALPLIWTFGAAAGNGLSRFAAPGRFALLSFLFFTQLVWAWYMAKVYFG